MSTNNQINKELIVTYKDNVKKSGLKDELYKWEMIGKFQGQPKLDSQDFSAAVSAIGYGNLIYPVSLSVIKHIADVKPLEYRDVLSNLFNSNVELNERIVNYIQGAEDLYLQVRTGPEKNHFQDERTIASILAFYDPSKYALFKDSFYQKYCKKLGIKAKGKNEKYSHYLELLKDLKVDIADDIELNKIIGSLIPAEYYQDENLNLLAQDILYQTLDVMSNQKDESITPEEIERKNKDKVNPHIIMNPLNQILFGPPGTGKTYNTINKALEILGEHEYLNNGDRKAIKDRYDEYVISGQIVFTTFHQSMSYEDFIEGIKPVNTNLNVTYEIVDGIFKSIADEAAQNYSLNINPGNDFEEVFSQLKNEWILSDRNEVEIKMKDKSYWITNITNRNIDFRKASGGTGHNMVIKTLESLYTNERTMDSGLAIYYFPLIEKLRTYRTKQKKDVSNRNFVLIIDEINRGNVSQIFGELITLIEDDKRIGRGEELKIKLPYSKELFGVPPNLYIIGTMNTADRSVEALDNALRRRFVFEEMNPDFELLNPYNRLGKLWADNWKEEPESNRVYWNNWDYLESKVCTLPKFSINKEKYIKLNKSLKPKDHETWVNTKNYEEVFKDMISEGQGGIRLDKLLEKMNLRIEKLLGKDYQIGHAFFVNIYTLDELRNVFHQKIIPLLQEYFYGDIGKIALVIGDTFMEKVSTEKVLFNSSIYHDQGVISDMESKVNYTFSKKRFLD